MKTPATPTLVILSTLATRMRSRARALISVALFVGVVHGCALTSDGRGQGGTGGDGGAGFGGAGFGGAGFGGGGGTGGFFAMDAGSAGTAGPFTSCAREMCSPPTNLGAATGLLAPCCTTEGRCGLGGTFLDQCLTIDAIGRDDPTCPAANLIGMPLTGCCTPQGACGLNLGQISLGCVERGSLPQNGFFDLGGEPVNIACFNGTDSDAGTDDGGASICAWARMNFCDPVASCRVEDRAPVCECPTGYADLSESRTRGTLCRDINECLLGASICDGGTCVNTPGSFSCE